MGKQKRASLSKNYAETMSRIRSETLSVVAEVYYKNRRGGIHNHDLIELTGISNKDPNRMRKRLREQFGWVFEEVERLKYRLVGITLKANGEYVRSQEKFKAEEKRAREAAKGKVPLYEVKPGSIDEKLNEVFGLWNG